MTSVPQIMNTLLKSVDGSCDVSMFRKTGNDGAEIFLMLM